MHITYVFEVVYTTNLNQQINNNIQTKYESYIFKIYYIMIDLFYIVIFYFVRDYYRIIQDVHYDILFIIFSYE